jgi:hypothetical protein
VPSLPLPSGDPFPSLPLSSGAPVPSLPASSDETAGPGRSGPGAGSSQSGGELLGSPGGSDAPGAGGTTGGDQGSPFSFALPLLIAGIPIALIILIVLAQLAGGAVWLPVIRRWLNRGLTPDG